MSFEMSQCFLTAPRRVTRESGVKWRIPIGSVAVLLWLASSAVEAQTALSSLRVLEDIHPRVWYFRSPEGVARTKLPFEQWEHSFLGLMGIQGKALAEESAGLHPLNVEYFSRFKQRHPDQLVLLHMNGNARDPRFQAGAFFAGHWLYFNGARILSAVPAEEGETAIRVDHPELFRLNIGRQNNLHEDLGLCVLDEQGKPDWSLSEQVRLVAVDAEHNLIRVQRGQFGTKPRAFAATRAYAASHVYEGPWDQPAHLMWFYNYSTKAPRSPQGRSLIDVLVEDIGARFAPGGEMAAFDGLEFDVLFHRNQYNPDLRPNPRQRGMDADADGNPDGGYFAGVNTYGAEVVEFCRRLRARLGADKLIMADGMGVANLQSQRAFGILNGIESEGFPHHGDPEVIDWSGGLNRFAFWKANAHPPAFNYIRHSQSLKMPASIHRLVFAAAAFSDAGMAFFLSGLPQPEPGEATGLWDEMRMGTTKRLGWLGKPLAPAVRLAVRQPDALSGQGCEPGRFRSDSARIESDSGSVRITSNAGTADVQFRLEQVPVKGPDLVVTLIARAEPMRKQPREIARLMWVSVGPNKGERFMTWVNERSFASAFYFRDLGSDAVNLTLEVEGSEPVWIQDLQAFSFPDVMYREFEHGLVLANPSNRPFTFALGDLLGGQQFRRLAGSPGQDPGTNDGSMAGAAVTLGAKDGLFLVRDHPE